jgi:hypothetical protein
MIYWLVVYRPGFPKSTDLVYQLSLLAGVYRLRIYRSNLLA